MLANVAPLHHRLLVGSHAVGALLSESSHGLLQLCPILLSSAVRPSDPHGACNQAKIGCHLLISIFSLCSKSLKTLWNPFTSLAAHSISPLLRLSPTGHSSRTASLLLELHNIVFSITPSRRSKILSRPILRMRAAANLIAHPHPSAPRHSCLQECSYIAPRIGLALCASSHHS